MLELERKWLAAVPWEAVAAMNRQLCEKDEQLHAPNPAGHEVARRLWEEAGGKTQTLREALGCLRQTHQLAPFRFFNGNTMAAMAQVMAGEVLAAMPPVQAQMAKSTVAHYVVGAIKLGELEDVLKYVGQVWRRNGNAGAQAAAPAMA